MCRGRHMQRRAHADVGRPAHVVDIRDGRDLAPLADAAGPADIGQDYIDRLARQSLLELPAGAFSLARCHRHLQCRRQRHVPLHVLGRERVFQPAHAQALKLCDFLLTEDVQSAILTQLGGFPGVSWDYVSTDLRKKFESIVPKSIPVFPKGDWTTAVNDGWYRNVATGLKQGS